MMLMNMIIEGGREEEDGDRIEWEKGLSARNSNKGKGRKEEIQAMPFTFSYSGFGKESTAPILRTHFKVMSQSKIEKVH